MKILEKKVHFVAEETSVVVCYDSKGSLMRYLLIDGEPYISLDNSVDRLFNIADAKAHNNEVDMCMNNRSDIFAHVGLTGVINGKFINSKCSVYKYAERPCQTRTRKFFLSCHVQSNEELYKAHGDEAMIIALYIPEELANAYRKERFQPTLARFKRYAKQAGTPADLRIARQLEASFCVSREIVKGNGGVPLVGPGFPEADWQVQDSKESER